MQRVDFPSAILDFIANVLDSFIVLIPANRIEYNVITKKELLGDQTFYLRPTV